VKKAKGLGSLQQRTRIQKENDKGSDGGEGNRLKNGETLLEFNYPIGRGNDKARRTSVKGMWLGEVGESGRGRGGRGNSGE